MDLNTKYSLIKEFDKFVKVYEGERFKYPFLPRFDFQLIFADGNCYVGVVREPEIVFSPQELFDWCVTEVFDHMQFREDIPLGDTYEEFVNAIASIGTKYEEEKLAEINKATELQNP